MMPALEQESMQNHIYNSVYEPTQVIDKPPAVPEPPPKSPILEPLKVQNKRKQQFGTTQQSKRPKK